MSDPHEHAWAVPWDRIICQRGDGVGSRLLTLLWTVRLARTADAGVLMFWPEFDQFSCKGSCAADIFDRRRISSEPSRDRSRSSTPTAAHTSASRPSWRPA